MGATHGKKGNVFRARQNGFDGDGLNDLTWGTGFSGGSSAYFEVEIDAADTPDTFKWRKDGGAWTEDVAITGAAQTLSDGQQVTFAATTGHTLADKWTAGNLKDEACTESGATAQITDATKRVLNPNSTVTFSDSGGANVLRVDYTRGIAYFDANVATVTVTSALGYVLQANIEKCGYLYGWEFEASLELSEKTVFQEDWKDWEPGQSEASGSAEGYLAGDNWFTDLTEAAVDGEYYFVQLFSYDPDDDQTGDHYNAWVLFSGLNVNAPIGDIVKEKISFKVCGFPSFVVNV